MLGTDRFAAVSAPFWGETPPATGDHSDVLKVKPPLCITLDSVGFFVDRLDQVLTEGW